MAGTKDFLPSLLSPALVKRISPRGDPKETRQIRAALLFLLGLTLLLIGGSFLYRQLPSWLESVSESETIVSQRYPSVAPSPTPTPKLEKEKLAVEEMIQPLRGKYGVYFQDLQTKDSFEINGEEKMQSASLIKLPVLLTLYREGDAGRVNLDTVYKLQAADKREGAGMLINQPEGFEVTYRKMAELMGKQSDNTAFYIVSRILGAEKIQETIDALGMKDSSFVDQITTPEDIGLFFRKLYREGVISQKGRDEIMSFLTDTIWEDRIPAGVPEGIKVTHKIGTLTGVISDAGIVFAPKPFVLVIMSQDANEIEAKKALPEITKKIYEMWTTEVQ